MNIPSSVIKELGLKDEDYILIKAKKAEWYDLIDWSKSSKTFDNLPVDLKMKIEKNKSTSDDDLEINKKI